MNIDGGLFITFEGGEGSGKSTQARLLYRKLLKLGLAAVLTHEPGVTALGKRLTGFLKWAKGTPISPLTELMLFNASRAQLMDEVILPALSAGKIIVCDRFADSTTAYQGYGRGLDLASVEAINNIATQGIKPHLTVLLDMPVEHGLERKAEKTHDRFEQEKLDFHRRVRRGYLKLALDEPQRWMVVEAFRSQEQVAGVIWKRVSQLLAERG